MGSHSDGEEVKLMIHLQPASQDEQKTSSEVVRGFQPKHLLLFILASILIHSLGLLIFGVYHRTQPNAKEKTNSKPIEFVVVPPEESREKPPSETQKRATENSVAEKILKPEKTSTETIGEETAPSPIKTPPPPAPPQETTNAPKIVEPPKTSPSPQPVKPPKTQTTPTPPPESTESLTDNSPPVLSGSDTASITQPKPAEKDSPVATRLAPQSKPSTPVPESVFPQPTATPSKPSESNGSGAASLLEGDYQKTLANGGGDAFFSPEALNYESVLNPAQLNALKDVDLSEYFAEIKRRVKGNWNPSFAVEEYTTFLAFDIQKNGQITGLRVTRSSGSEKVDRESLEAVQDSAPFAPLPPEFPLEAMKVQFSFNIYIY